MTIRYREHTGVTNKSIDRFNKHIGRLGKLSYIKGYRYQTTTRCDEAVLIRGENGTIRLSGLLWGYGGEGPSGLKTVLTSLGVDESVARQTAYHTPRDYSKIGEDWRINL